MTVEAVVADAIARARRNVELGLPLDHGADVDEILVSLGLPRREQISEPPLEVAILRESGPRRFKRRRRTAR